MNTAAHCPQWDATLPEGIPHRLCPRGVARQADGILAARTGATLSLSGQPDPLAPPMGEGQGVRGNQEFLPQSPVFAPIELLSFWSQVCSWKNQPTDPLSRSQLVKIDRQADRHVEQFRYVRSQEAHYQRMTFQEEFLALPKSHRVEYNPRYLWE